MESTMVPAMRHKPFAAFAIAWLSTLVTSFGGQEHENVVNKERIFINGHQHYVDFMDNFVKHKILPGESKTGYLGNISLLQDFAANFGAHSPNLLVKLKDLQPCVRFIGTAERIVNIIITDRSDQKYRFEFTMTDTASHTASQEKVIQGMKLDYDVSTVVNIEVNVSQKAYMDVTKPWPCGTLNFPMLLPWTNKSIGDATVANFGKTSTFQQGLQLKIIAPPDPCPVCQEVLCNFYDKYGQNEFEHVREPICSRPDDVCSKCDNPKICRTDWNQKEMCEDIPKFKDKFSVQKRVKKPASERVPEGIPKKVHNDDTPDKFQMETKKTSKPVKQVGSGINHHKPGGDNGDITTEDEELFTKDEAPLGKGKSKQNGNDKRMQHAGEADVDDGNKPKGDLTGGTSTGEANVDDGNKPNGGLMGGIPNEDSTNSDIYDADAIADMCEECLDDFCEGLKNSDDFDVLNNLLCGMPGLPSPICAQFNCEPVVCGEEHVVRKSCRSIVTEADEQKILKDEEESDQNAAQNTKAASPLQENLRTVLSRNALLICGKGTRVFGEKAKSGNLQSTCEKKTELLTGELKVMKCVPMKAEFHFQKIDYENECSMQPQEWWERFDDDGNFQKVTSGPNINCHSGTWALCVLKPSDSQTGEVVCNTEHDYVKLDTEMCIAQERT